MSDARTVKVGRVASTAVRIASRAPRPPRCCWCQQSVEGAVMTAYDGVLDACRACGEPRGTFWAYGEEMPELW